MNRGENVFVTGATGVIGHALVQQLKGRNVTALVHRDRRLPCHVDALAGDLCSRQLGLSAVDYRDLAQRTTHVAHCAWHADPMMPADEIERTNLLATRQVLEFAAVANAHVIYVSSAFAAPSHAAEVRLAAMGHRDRAWSGVLAYVRFKQACERLVLDSGLPASIVRQSIVMGDSRTGQIARFQGAQMLLGFAFNHQLPLLPAAPDTLIDFLPQDIVARAIEALLSPDPTIRVCTLTAGTQAVALRRLVELTLDVASSAGHPVEPPTLVDPDSPATEYLVNQLPPKARRRYELTRALLCLYQRTEPFPTSLHELVGVDALDLQLEHVYTATLRYWAGKQRVEARGG